MIIILVVNQNGYKLYANGARRTNASDIDKIISCTIYILREILFPVGLLNCD